MVERAHSAQLTAHSEAKFTGSSEGKRAVHSAQGPARHGLSVAAVICFVLLLIGASMPGCFAQEPVLDPVDEPAFVEAAAPRAEAEITTPAPEVGEQVKLLVKLPGPQEYEAITLEIPKEQTGLLVVEESIVKSDGGWLATLRALKPGDQTIGPFTIEAVAADGTSAEFSTAPLAISVATPAGDVQDAKDYRPPLQAPFNWVRFALFLLAGLILLVILSAILLYIARRFRRALPTGSTPAPLLSPIAEAMTSLGNLEKLEVYHAEGTKAHYSVLSMLLRRYVERQYGIPAQEMTEDEVVRWLREKLATHGGALELKKVLDNASLAKFAKWDAAVNRVMEDLETSRLFLSNEDERLRIESQASRTPGVMNAEGRAA